MQVTAAICVAFFAMASTDPALDAGARDVANDYGYAFATSGAVKDKDFDDAMIIVKSIPDGKRTAFMSAAVTPCLELADEAILGREAM